MAAFFDFKGLREVLDFRAILQHYEVELFEKPNNQVLAFCPLPNHVSKDGKARSPSFSANLERKIWQCFSCGASGNAIEFANYMEGFDPKNGADFRKVALQLDGLFNGGRMGGSVSAAQSAGSPALNASANKANHKNHANDQPDACGDDQAASPAPVAASTLPVVINPPLTFELKELDTAHAYLPSRGFTPETIARFGLGYCSRGLMKGRVVVPLKDSAGALIGYAGRIVDDETINADCPRYLLPSSRDLKGERLEFHKSLFLYGGYAIEKPVNDLIVVEGFTALWWLWQHGFKHVVALMGSTCSNEQAALIIAHTKPKGRIWCFGDGDAAGIKCAKDTLALLAPARSVRLVLVDGKQPTDFSESELKAALPFQTSTS
jgi:DNA primase